MRCWRIVLGARRHFDHQPQHLRRRHQLIHDWYAKPGNLAIAVETFDGCEAGDFLACWRAGPKRRMPIGWPPDAGRMSTWNRPCNPHGYVLDVPGICRAAHGRGCA